MSARNVARALTPLSKQNPGGARPTPAPQGAYSGMISPLQAQLESGGSMTGYANAYGGFLPRPTNTFTAGAFGPFSPILPVPVDQPPSPDATRAEPRLYQYDIGWNLPVGTPGSEGLKLASFSTIQTLADLYSVARACIELRKAEIRGLAWDITPTKDASKKMRGDTAAMEDFGERRAEAVEFFKHPDPDYDDWGSFISVLLEEVFVFDALSILMRPKWGSANGSPKGNGKGKGLFGSDLDSLSLINGPTIRPLVGLHGERPRPPAPAYQQYLYGVPRTDLTTMWTERDLLEAGLSDAQRKEFRGDQLIYRPFTPRRWTPYGFTMIEQALVPVMAGLQKQGYQLDFFREGTIPGMFVSPGAANQMTPNQIRELQSALNAVAGDVAQKHKIIVLPPDSKVMPQKPAELADQFDEIVMNQVCMAFSVQPMELGIMPKVSSTVSPGASNQMAKATQGIHERKATKPTLEFLASIFNMILQDVCGQEDMQFTFEGLEEDEDEETLTTLLVSQIGAGLASIDEGREALGKQPWGLPETSDPGWATMQGFIPLGQMLTTGVAAPGQQPDANTPATATPPGAAPAKPGAKPAPAKPGAKPAGKPSGNAGQSPGHAASEAAANAAGKPSASSAPASSGKVAAPQISKFQAAHQARRSTRVLAAAAHVRSTLRSTVEQYQAGNITHMAAMTAATGVLADGYAKAMHAASHDAANDYPDVNPIDVSGAAQTRANNQQAFLSVLLYTALNMVGTDWLNSRLTAYENTVAGAYNQAFGQTVQASNPEYGIIWHLGNAEHCKPCIDRDGKVYTFHSLPGYPGDGGFGGQCAGGPNCHCSLEYVEPGSPSLWGSNTQLPDATGYYRQQLDDITAMRQDAAAARADYLGDIPTDAGMRAMTRDQIRQDVADLANQEIRAGGGYPGVSVEPVDVSADVVAQLVPAWAKSRAVDSELAALARHYRKGRDIASWRPRHIDSAMVMSIDEDVTKGLTVEQAILVAKATRRVELNGQEVWVDPPGSGQVTQYQVAAGGGGRVLPAHDVDGVEVPGGVPGSTAGGEPPRWDGAQPRRRVRTAPPDEDDAEMPPGRGVPAAQGGGPAGGAPSMARLGTGQPGSSSPPGAVKGASDPGDPNPVDAVHVKNLMLDNFPAKALKWVDDTRWIGPVQVAVDRVDVGGVKTWAASHQPDRVAHFADLLKRGKPVKPGICVQEPGETEVKIIDGHHRYLAAKQAGVPYMAYVGFVDSNGGPWDETHSYQVHQGADPANKSVGPAAAGLAVVAKDTGRVLMLQRALTEDDPAGGSWELPGGRLDEGEHPADAASREWQEETGCHLPDGELKLGFTSTNGVYQVFTLTVAHETDVPIHDGRDQVTNPDDPDGDQVEALAWWNPGDLRDNPAVRDELHGSMNALLRTIRDA